MKIKIEDLDLSVKSYNCLKKAGVQTIEEMALVDLNKIGGCGKNSKEEISAKIKFLINNGYFSQEFINDYLSTDDTLNFVDSLNISNRAKNILKNIKIERPDQLLSLNEDTLYRVRNAGKSSISEILSYIENNKEELLIQQNSYSDYQINYPIHNISNFSGQIKISSFPISKSLIRELNINDIITINDLITNKINVSNLNYDEYNKNYEFFYNLAYGELKLNIPNSLKECSVSVPFDILEYKRNDFIKINDLINFSLSRFNDFDLKEKINIKLFLYWLNTYDTENVKKDFINSLNLNDREYEILSNRTIKTLEELGNEYNITRERIRQIESKVLKKVKEKYLKFPFRLLNNDKVYYVDNCDGDDKLLLFFDENFDSNYIKVKDDYTYYLPKGLYFEITAKINEHVNDFENKGYIIIQENENEDLFYKTIKYMNLCFNNGYLFKKYTKRQTVKYVMRYIDRPINLSNQTDMNEVIKVAKEIFDLELENTRALEALILDAGVRVGSGTYAADDQIIDLDKNMLSEIVRYIKEKRIINTRDLFVIFGDDLRDHNFDNDAILYRYLKEKLSDKLYFNGVSAVISSEENLGSWGDLVIELIKKTKKPVNKLDFMVQYSVTEAVYMNLAINFDDIIIWSGKELYLKSMINKESIICQKLMDFVKTNQIVSFNQILKFMNEFDENYIENNNIYSSSNLYYYLDNVLDSNYIIDRNNEEVRTNIKKKTVIEEKYENINELTL